jgi:methenyltetrahydrofolate cyclohydrolase
VDRRRCRGRRLTYNRPGISRSTSRPAASAIEDPPTDQPPTADPLIDRPAREFIDRLSTSAPIPGGGSASAFAGAMGAALVGMVVELTRDRPDAVDHAAELEAIGSEAGRLRRELVELTDLDADAYHEVVSARRLPKSTDEERAARQARIVDATREATLAPLQIARAAAATLALAGRLAPIGNPNALSDVGVAALLAATALRGATLNVRINLPFLPPDDPLPASAESELGDLMANLEVREGDLRGQVEDRIG